MGDTETKKIYDFVGGIQGNYVDTITEGVSADHPDLENPCRIEYIPDRDFWSALKIAFKQLFGFKGTVISQRVYPEKAIKHDVQESTEPGVPDKYIVIQEDEYENQPWLEKEEQDFEGSLAKLEKDLNAAKKDGMMKEVERMEAEDEGKREKEPSSRGRRRNRKSGSSMDEMFD